MTTVHWNADDYAKHSRGQFGWAMSVIDRLHPAPDARVLDIGCGDGKVTIELARRVPRGSVVGIDSSPAMIELAQATWDGKATSVEFRRMDAQALDFDAEVGGFDIVFSNAALHWARDQPAVLRGVAAALAPGGRTFFSMGGRGTAAVVYRVLAEMTGEKNRWGRFLETAVSPHFFRGPEEYDGWLRDAGLVPRRVELVRKPMRHADATALLGWLRTTWTPFTSSVPEERRAEFLAELLDRVRPGCDSGEGDEILMPMVNLEVEAVKPA
jgi:trans-aconitate methyltransferase